MTYLNSDHEEVFAWLHTLSLRQGDRDWIDRMEQAMHRQGGALSNKQVGVLERIVEKVGQGDADIRGIFLPTRDDSPRQGDSPRKRPKRRKAKKAVPRIENPALIVQVENPVLEIYTDGSCNPNPGRGGWGVVIIEGRKVTEFCGGDPDTTNNRMEMQGIVEALKRIPDGTPAVIYSDSRLCIQQASGRWKARTNRDLVEQARTLASRKTVELRWIRGHNGHRWNELADQLAARGRYGL